MNKANKGYNHIMNSTSTKQSTPPILKPIKDYLLSQTININGQDAINEIVYGLNCKQITKSQSEDVVLLQQDIQPFIITLLNLKTSDTEIIDLSKLTHIAFDSKSENLKGYKPKSPNTIVQLLNKQISYDFDFISQDNMLTFLTAIAKLFSYSDLFDDNDLVHQIKKIWYTYDKDFSLTLTKKEFKLFTHDLNMLFNEKIDFDLTYRRIDTNSNGLIDFDEFVAFFQSFTDGHEYKELFNTLLSNKDNSNNNGNASLSCNDVKRFFNEKQKDDLSLLDVQKIIILHKQKLTKIQKEDIIAKLDKKIELTTDELALLHLTLEEFKLLLHSPITNILDYNKINEGHNMNRPINDYYINSTHNTYLTGHQLTSDSSAEMYSFSVLEGYRLVELDCYNGSGDDIVITHGYTFTTSLHLKDVLIQLKRNAFLNSSYPVILSIENHLDTHHQKIMAKLFKEILVDLYIFSQDNDNGNGVPDYLPSLIEMKNKFIIKCGGKRILKDREKITPRSKLRYIVNRDINEEKGMESLEESNKKISELLISEVKHIQKNSKTSFDLINKVIIDQQKLKQIKKNEETSNELSQVRGLFGTKFKYDHIISNNYQPWEMVTIKCNKVIAFASDFFKRKAIIHFTQNSLIKAYPTDFNSSNFDPIKCWIVGCQVAAMNIQSTKDDWTLLNMIFFSNNRNRGYVLKPAKLLPESTKIETYEQPYGKINIDVINLIGLFELLKAEGIDHGKIDKIRLECFLVGSNADDKNNERYTLHIEGDYVIPTIITKKAISFDIYEKDLSCIYFKVYYEKDIIGKSVVPLMMMKEGVRRIGLYDNNCIEIKNSFIVAIIDKTY